METIILEQFKILKSLFSETEEEIKIKESHFHYILLNFSAINEQRMQGLKTPAFFFNREKFIFNELIISIFELVGFSLEKLNEFDIFIEKKVIIFNFELLILTIKQNYIKNKNLLQNVDKGKIKDTFMENYFAGREREAARNASQSQINDYRRRMAEKHSQKNTDTPLKIELDDALKSKEESKVIFEPINQELNIFENPLADPKEKLLQHNHDSEMKNDNSNFLEDNSAYKQLSRNNHNSIEGCIEPEKYLKKRMMSTFDIEKLRISEDEVVLGKSCLRYTNEFRKSKKMIEVEWSQDLAEIGNLYLYIYFLLKK